MRSRNQIVFAAAIALFWAGPFVCKAAEMPVEEAWKAMPKFQAGQDMAALLAVDRAVIGAMASPETRAACAARLAALLEAPDTTPSARQYICLQLRQVGTAAQVPMLARLLAKPETSQMARYALECIPGDQSLAALREGLAAVRGSDLVGVINSLAARNDAPSVPKLCGLAGSDDKQVASAALWALGRIANSQSAAFLLEKADKAPVPMPQELVVPLLRCASAMIDAGKSDSAQAIYTKLSQSGQSPGVRRAALEGLLRVQGAQAEATVLAWFTDADADKRKVAGGRLASLPEARIDQFVQQWPNLSDAHKAGLLELLAARKGKSVLPLVTSAMASSQPELKLAGLRCLGVLGDASDIPALVNCLAGEGPAVDAAQHALCNLPRKAVGEAMLAALKDRPDSRPAVIEVLGKLKFYEAVDSLIVMAKEEDKSVYGPALDGLKGICDPDKADLSRLVDLLLAVPAGQHRDDVERTILIVCEKASKRADHAAPVLAVLAKVDPSQSPKYLPLLGRLGGAAALKRIDAALASDNPEIKQAGLRGLCNWPSAEVADRLWDVVSQETDPAARRAALRAYVRVVGLKSDRPESQTLAMLQKAMKQADNADDKQLVLSRVSNVRTLEAVDWVAGYLDDPELAQAACKALADLAHHRFLRHPNMARFAPLLEKVGKISTDPAVRERAEKYRLGL